MMMITAAFTIKVIVFSIIGLPAFGTNLWFHNIMLNQAGFQSLLNLPSLMVSSTDCKILILPAGQQITLRHLNRGKDNSYPDAPQDPDNSIRKPSGFPLAFAISRHLDNILILLTKYVDRQITLK
jgi:hypothetical protein